MSAQMPNAWTPGRPNFKRWRLIFFNIITALYSITYKNVYQLTSTEERAPENGKVHKVTPEFLGVLSLELP